MSNDWIFVVHLYWNSVQQKCLILADERHKICLDIATHASTVFFGAQYMNGFDIGNYDPAEIKTKFQLYFFFLH